MWYKVNSRGGGSYIDSPNWIKNKKATINPKNKDDKCFEYAITITLNYEEIKKNPERASSIKPFTNKYKSKGINYPSKLDDWKTLRRIMRQLFLIFSILKKRNVTSLYFNNYFGLCITKRYNFKR